MTDKTILTALLTCGKLSEDEEAAFRNMLERLENNKKPTALTVKQRQWTQLVYDRLDLTAEEGSANLISSGKYVPSAEEMQKKYPWETARKPRKPPGRMCPEGTGLCKVCVSCRADR
jgi:hypothetical protein